MRAADLVSGDRHQVEVAVGEVDRHVRQGLHRVAVDGDPVLVGHAGYLGHGLDRAHLVVGPHDADESNSLGVLLDGGPHGGRGDQTLGIRLHPGDLRALVRHEVVHAVEDGVVLDGADDQPVARGVLLPPGCEGALDGQVVGLGASRREHHLGRPGPDRPRQPLPGLLDDAAGGPPAVWSEDGLPVRAICSAIAASADGSIGVVAAWSR